MKTTLIAVLMVVCLHTATVFGQLTARVTPGYTFSSGEIPTTAKLNLAASPTIAISGTVSGTVGLSAGSVNGTHFADSVVDDTTLSYTNTSPRALRIKPYGVGITEINTNIAGFGIDGGNGVALSFNAAEAGDTNSITGDANGHLTLATNSIPVNRLASVTNSVVGAGTLGTNQNLTLGPMLAITATSLVVTGYVSSQFAVTVNGGSLADTAHGLANKPRLVRWVLICTTANAGYAVNDEVEADGLVGSDGATITKPLLHGGANATNVFMTITSGLNPYLPNKGTGAETQLTTGSWRLKCYAFP